MESEYSGFRPDGHSDDREYVPVVVQQAFPGVLVDVLTIDLDVLVDDVLTDDPDFGRFDDQSFYLLGDQMSDLVAGGRLGDHSFADCSCYQTHFPVDQQVSVPSTDFSHLSEE